MKKKTDHRPVLLLLIILLSVTAVAMVHGMDLGTYDLRTVIESTSQNYVEPDVKITINAPSGWYTDKAKVTFEAEDLKGISSFRIKSVKAKIGQNGTYQDVTDDMSLEITENCSVYVLVTDSQDKSYERSRRINCFDNTKPTLNAAVSNGVLTVKAQDLESGVKTIYVNGYEFTDFEDDTLVIRLKKFDSGYEYFTVQVKDNAGNMSETYKAKNPYYKDKNSKSGSSGNTRDNLPVSVSPTSPSNATAVVTSHTTSDTPAMATEKSEDEGSSVKTPQEVKKAEFAKADEEEREMLSDEKEDAGSEYVPPQKEFYTVMAASGKVFYLIIDRTTQEEKVYFLTEITENDLLNVTTDNKEELPMNSAAVDSGIPIEEEALDSNSPEYSETVEVETPPEIEETEEEPIKEPEPKKTPVAFYIILGILAFGVIGAAYYFKFVFRKDERDYAEEDEDEDDEYEQGTGSETQTVAEDMKDDFSYCHSEERSDEES